MFRLYPDPLCHGVMERGFATLGWSFVSGVRRGDMSMKRRKSTAGSQEKTMDIMVIMIPDLD